MKRGPTLGLELLDQEITWGDVLKTLGGVALAVVYGWVFIVLSWGAMQ